MVTAVLRRCAAGTVDRVDEVVWVPHTWLSVQVELADRGLDVALGPVEPCDDGVDD